MSGGRVDAMIPGKTKHRRNGRRWLALGALVLATTVGCKRDERTPVVLYSPHGRDLLQLFEQTYEKAHPEIDVRWLDMGSQEVYDRVRAEQANPQGDVWFGGPSTIFARGASEGLLQQFEPSWASAVPAECWGPDKTYHCLYRTAPVLVYNSDALSAAEAPGDWDELLDPKWKGKIVIRDPLASGTMRTVFCMMVARAASGGSPEPGFDWLRRLDGQTREYTQNPALLFTKLARREGLITIWELTDMFWQKQRGIPLGFRFPASGTPIIDDSVGLIAGAPHAEAAKAFVEWVGTPEAQLLSAEKAYRLPARTDIATEKLPQWAKDVLAQMRPAAYDRQAVAEHGQEWMERWDREVRGKGGA